jgi:GntR family transcriptional regulator, rspAB operon transcriptional repressor
LRRVDTQTVEDQVFFEIRRAILSGQLEPETRLLLRDLSDRLGVSSLPVRAALSRLRAEGLVVHVPRSGSVVAPIEYEELEEIQALRLGIEGLAARLGAERITAPAVKQMAHQLEIVERLAGEHDLDRYLRAEWAYRELCFRASGRDRLVEYVRDLRLRAERYLRVAFSSPRGLPQSVGFQRELLSACESRDGARAEALTRNALEWTKEAMAEYFEQRADRQTAARAATGS